ncbi:MAG: ribonuclease III [Bacteroidales bacterium]|nr:ribonuclease III [Bacteroidales bacterium]
MFSKLFLSRYFSKDKLLYEKIKSIYGFYPRNIFLYKLALRHRSVAIEINSGIKVSNERLEYLGDAVLGSIVADYLFKKFPLKGEGFLTEMRSKIVSRESLNKLSITLGLADLVQYNTENNCQSKSMLGDTFEALVAAIYLDKGYKFCQSILINNIMLTHFDIEELISYQLNYKSKLLEWSQHNKKKLEFRLMDTSMKGKKKNYKVTVFVDNTELATSFDFSIKSAEKAAAAKSWEILSDTSNRLFPEASPAIINVSKN